MTIMSLISAIDYKKVVNVRLIYTITTALLVVYPFVSYKPYFYMVNKINIERYLDEEYSSVKYTIKKSRKTAVKHFYDEEGWSSCDQYFDVSLNDGANLTFQSSYCEYSSPYSEFNFEGYRVKDNYFQKYMPYYLKKFNKENNANLIMYNSSEDIDEDD